MGVIQSGINQAIQTAAIIGQLQEVPQKKAERKITAAKLENIEEEKKQAKKFFSAIKDEKTLAEQQEQKENLWTPEAKQYYSDLRNKEISLRDRYQKAGGKESKYLPEPIDPQDKIEEITSGEKWPGYPSLEYEYGIPTITDIQLKSENVPKNVHFDKNKLDEALEFAAKQRETYGYVNENLRANIQKALLNMEVNNGK